MKKVLEYSLIAAFLLLSFSCSNEAGEEENVEPNVQDEMYFPPVGSDTWETTGLQELGWDQANLQAAIDYAQEKNSTALVILHNGRMVAEHYWKETNRHTKRNIESVGKGVTAFLIGILQQEFNFSIKEKVSTYLGHGWSKAPAEKEDLITSEHLLTMTSGLDYNLNYLADAGAIWYYSNEAYEVLLKMIESVSGLNIQEFSGKFLFSKTGMSKAVWNNNVIECTARDMARFGLLILAEGSWEGEEILKDKEYYSSMLATSQSLQPPYGYLWWLNGKESYTEFGEGKEDVVYPGPLYSYMPSDGVIAAGRHDQRIEVLPESKVVVVRQGEDPQTPERGEDSYGNGFWQRLSKAIGY